MQSVQEIIVVAIFFSLDLMLQRSERNANKRFFFSHLESRTVDPTNQPHSRKQIINLRNGFTRDYANGKHLTDDISRRSGSIEKDEMKTKKNLIYKRLSKQNKIVINFIPHPILLSRWLPACLALPCHAMPNEGPTAILFCLSTALCVLYAVECSLNCSPVYRSSSSTGDSQSLSLQV